MSMTPREIVHELNRHIIGQTTPSAPWPSPCATAGGATQLPAELRQEVTPKNILMIGPTGVGKTEIARRSGQAGQRAVPEKWKPPSSPRSVMSF